MTLAQLIFAFLMPLRNNQKPPPKRKQNEFFTCKGLLARTCSVRKVQIIKNILSVETKNSVEKHMRKLRASGLKTQIAPERELTKTQNVFYSGLSSKDSDMDIYPTKMFSFSTNLNTPIMSKEQRISCEREKLSPSLFLLIFIITLIKTLKKIQEMMALLIKFKPNQGFDFVLQNIQMCMVNNTCQNT